MPKKLIGLVVCLLLIVSLTACGTVAQKNPGFDSKTKTSNSADKIIAEKDGWRLELDKLTLGVTLVDTSTGKMWGTTPQSSDGPQFDELGMPIKKHPQVESAVTVLYKNAETGTEDSLLSYTDAVDEGRTVCKKTKSGVLVKFYFDSAKIMIPVEYRLEDNGAVHIGINPDGIEEGKNQVLQISVAPFWCSAENDTQDAYLFVPSGSGALVNVNSRSVEGTIYETQVYGRDYSIAENAQISQTESVRLPVYGVKNADTGCLAIIDGGAESAWITANVGSTAIEYSAVYATFQMRGYTNHTAMLFSSTKVENVVYSNQMIKTPVSVTYYPLEGENADYNGMAAKYRDYLKADKKLNGNSKDVSLNLNFVGGTLVTKSFLGIPYKTVYPTAELSKVSDIVKNLSSKIDGRISVNLKGYGASGVDQGKVAGGYKINSNLGSEKDLKNLENICKNKKIDLYMDFDIVKFNRKSKGFSTFSDVAINSGEQKATQYYYDIAVNDQLTDTMYYLLSPSRYVDATQKLIDKTDNFDLPGISLDTVSNMLYSDYGNKKDSKYYSRSGVSGEAEKAVNLVKKANKHYMSIAANYYAAVRSDIITDVPTCSSEEYIFDRDIPFYAMVFKGYVPMTVESLNLTSDSNEMMLKAVEIGAGINYTLISQWDNELITSNHRYFYNSIYSNLSQEIISKSQRLADYYTKISGAHIVSHSILESGVRETDFDNGVSVFVNYGDSAVQSPAGEIQPHDYLVLERPS